VGVAIKRWVSFHGFSLNYETNLKYFELINPCGLEGKKMTSMGKILGERISRDILVERICFHFSRNLKMYLEEKNIEEVITGFSSPSPQPSPARGEDLPINFPFPGGRG